MSNLRSVQDLIRPGALVFDVGAHNGEEAVRLLAWGSRVVCFDPHPDRVEAMRSRLGGNDAVTIVDKGLAAKPGTLDLATCSDGSSRSTMSEHWRHGRFKDCRWDRTIPVTVITLDQAIRIHGRPQHIKIHAAGFELSVLQGLSQSLPSVSFEFTGEFMDQARQCVRWLEGLGPYIFNCTLGEAEIFSSAAWLSSEDLFLHLQGSDDPLLRGEIYARSLAGEAPLQLWLPDQHVQQQEDLLMALARRPITQNIRSLYVVGAHRFDEKGILDRLFPNLNHLILFDPLPAVQAGLQELARADRRVRFFPYAISKTDGQAEFRLTDNDGMSSSLLPMKRHRQVFPSVHETNRIQVSTRTLKGVIAEFGLPLPDMLFLDVQGAEYDILDSLTPDVCEALRLIYTEASTEEIYRGARELVDIRALLAPSFVFMGYAPQRDQVPTHGNALFVRRENLGEVQTPSIPKGSSPGQARASSDGPLVTVIVSTYNAKDYLPSCLEDLERQTIFDRLEIIVVDSGSEQGEDSVVREFQRRHHNVIYLRTQRESLYAAWNRGVQLAHGTFITNANTDDAHRPDALERMADALNAFPDADLAYSDYAWTSVPNDTFSDSHAYREVIHPPFHPAHSLFYCILGCHPVWRRRVFQKLGLFKRQLSVVGDYEFLLRFVAAGLRPVHVPEVLSLFYQNPDGLTHTSDRRELAAIHERYRGSVPVERLYAVDPAQPGQVARAWIAQGTLALGCPIPWQDTPLRQGSYAQDCFKRALQHDPGNAIALWNLAMLLGSLGKDAEAEAFIQRLPAEQAREARGGLHRREYRFRLVTLPPSRHPLEYRRGEGGGAVSMDASEGKGGVASG
jgi:FkbM family methyltransferase